MSFDLPTSAIEQLKGFVLLCRTKPEIIHKPELKFFLDFLVSMGASIPPPPPASDAKPEEEKKSKPAETKEEAPKEETPEVREREKHTRIILIITLTFLRLISSVGKTPFFERDKIQPSVVGFL